MNDTDSARLLKTLERIELVLEQILRKLDSIEDAANAVASNTEN